MMFIEEETLNKVQTLVPRTIASGPSVRNSYFSLRSEAIDLYLKKSDTGLFSDWLDYKLPELFEFDDEIYYLSNREMNVRRFLRRPGGIDFDLDSYLQGPVSSRRVKTSPAKGGEVVYQSVINSSGNVLRMFYLSCLPERHIIHGFNLNLDKCFFNGKNKVYSKFFLEDVKNKEISVAKDCPKITAGVYNDAFELSKLFNGDFKLSDPLLKAGEIFMQEDELRRKSTPKDIAQESTAAYVNETITIQTSVSPTPQYFYPSLDPSDEDHDN